jgi:DNA-binding phage protein
MSTSRPFKTRQLEALQDAEQAALYLEEALEAGNIKAFNLALRNVAETQDDVSKAD